MFQAEGKSSAKGLRLQGSEWQPAEGGQRASSACLKFPSLTHQIPTEHLLWLRHCSRCRETPVSQTKPMLRIETSSLVGETPSHWWERIIVGPSHGNIHYNLLKTCYIPGTARHFTFVLFNLPSRPVGRYYFRVVEERTDTWKVKGPNWSTKLGSWELPASIDSQAPPHHLLEPLEKHHHHLIQDGAKIGPTKTAATKECALASWVPCQHSRRLFVEASCDCMWGLLWSHCL